MPSIRRSCRTLVTVLLAGLVTLSSTGCWWDWFSGGNVSFNFQIPLGLNGTIGILNPDGGSIGPGTQPPSDPNDPLIPPDDL